MDTLLNGLIAGITSSAILSLIISILLKKKTVEIEERVKNQFNRSLEVFKSKREWEEESLSNLLGPVYMQFDRTARAFKRWNDKNLYLEQKIIMTSNKKIRDLFLSNAHLIPPELLDDAGKLVEHYDRWLEEFEKKRQSEKPDLETAFIFAGPAGYPFPVKSEKNFKDSFKKMWRKLYGKNE